MLKKFKSFLITHEKSVIFYAIFLGFIVDGFTLPRIDILWGNVLLFTYLLVAFISLFLINLNSYSEIRYSFLRRIVPVLPFFTQFSLGALFSGYFIFYARSASFSLTWLFLLILIALLFGNDFLKNRYQRFEFQTGILFLATFFFTIFYVPIVMKEIGMTPFLVSGVVSLVLIAVFVAMSSRVLGENFKKVRNTVFFIVLGVYGFINLLYVANVIPPIPLALKESGVYHTLTKSPDGTYLVLSEQKTWFDFKEYYAPTVFYRYGGEPVYFFSAIFSPADLNTTILHEWQYFDVASDTWVTTDRLRFEIAGGRDQGYRGYTFKQSMSPGLYRINVITKEGQILGRTQFRVIDVDQKQNLSPKILGE